MNILVPLNITDSMLSSCSVSEPAAGEAVWVSGGTYAIGDRRIRLQTHMVYECVAAVSGSTVAPENDATHWLVEGPTLRWAAMADDYPSTKTTSTGSLSFTLRPGFFDAVALYGLVGASLSFVLKDAPGGTVVKSIDYLLQEDPLDWWDWAFGPARPLTKWFTKGLAPYADPELTITITAPAGGQVGIGMIVIGSLMPMVDASTWGGTQQGASASPTTFSYIKVDEYGGIQIKRRKATTDMQFKVSMPRERADYALALVQRVLDVPAAWIATDAPGFQGLNIYGLGSGSMSYDTFGTATFSGSVKGIA